MSSHQRRSSSNHKRMSLCWVLPESVTFQRRWWTISLLAIDAAKPQLGEDGALQRWLQMSDVMLVVRTNGAGDLRCCFESICDSSGSIACGVSSVG